MQIIDINCDIGVRKLVYGFLFARNPWYNKGKTSELNTALLFVAFAVKKKKVIPPR